MTNVTIKSEDFSKWINDLIARLPNMDLSPELKIVTDKIRTGVEQSFQSQSSPLGRPWSPAKTPQAHPLLVDSGRLKAGAIGPGEGHVEVITKNTLEFGTSIPYAEVHQRGNSRIPQRPFMGVSEQTLGECIEEITKGIMRQI